MTNNGIKSMLTIEDRKGFCIKDISKKDINKYIKINKEKGKLLLSIIIPCAILCWLATIIFKMMQLTENYKIPYVISSIFTIILVIISTIIYFKYIECDNSVMKLTYYIEVKIKEILDIENYNIPNTNGVAEISSFYPIIGIDTTTGYESICYVSENVYKNCKINDIININVAENHL